ncbi:DUF4468 domain-containing protein [Hymenobacter arizonensis]|uniref:DUF4468 domain-containing protein n=1 Tax=Hymenobacter arizonensis TaxID=1227077 RepID=UPI0015A56604|nr:DUF4468 domain-containing protein [Hymenobacter arizonensis]
MAQAQAQPAKATAKSSALPVDPDTGLVAYTGVVEVPGALQAHLYTRAAAWVAEHYPAATSAVQDKETGKLIVQGTAYPRAPAGFASSVTYTLSLYVKEGKYKYDFTGFRHEAKAGDDVGLGAFENEKVGNALTRDVLQKPWNGIRAETAAQVQRLIVSLAAAMNGAKDKSDF